MPELLVSREHEEYLVGTRDQRTDDFQAWKDRIDVADTLIKGDFSYANPDGVMVGGKPVVMNLADQVPRDLARIASETEPTYAAPAFGDTKEADYNAELRSVIGRGYFDFNRFDIARPQLVMDLAITGAFFQVVWYDSGSPYPRVMRVDPRACYPDVFNGEVQDLLVVQRIKLRVAQRLFPDVPFADYIGSTKKLSDDVEIWDYYGPKECIKGMAFMGQNGRPVGPGHVVILKSWDHQADKVPVAFAQLPSPDGAFRGIVDQVGPSLAAKNRAVNLLLEYAHEGIYAPFEEKGILNPNESPGPTTIYHHNPSASGETFMRRMAPAQFNPQLFNVVQYLDQEERGQLAYPNTRQGEVGISQGSASFVVATQGQLTSMVREVQRMLTSAQERVADLCFQLDQHFLDFEKPLIRSVGKKRTYKPVRDIGGRHQLAVLYGAGAGLDRLNADNRLLQFYSAGVLSAETMLSQTDFIPDPPTELERRENEEISRVILQRFAGDPTVSLDFINRVYEIKRDTGVTLVEAYSQANAEQPAQPTQPAPTDQTGMPTDQMAPEQGAQPAPEGGAPAIAGTFSPPPMQQVIVR